LSDTLSFGSRIGLITNLSTTFYSLLPLFVGNKEYNVLINRLKTCCVLQGSEIDKTKGINVYELPNWWDKWDKDSENSELNNKLLARQRPYFFRYVYQSWNKRYKHHYSAYNNLCIVRFGYTLDVLLGKENLSEAEQKVKDEFYKRSPLIDSPCTVNLICHYLEKEVKEVKANVKNDNFDYSIYMNPDIEVDENKLHKMELLYDKFRAFQRNSHDRSSNNWEDDEDEFPTRDEYIHVLEREAYYISNNISELANLLVEVCYGMHGENSKEFCWKLFGGRGLLDNLAMRCRGFMQVPVLDDKGTIEYLGKKYSLLNLVLSEGENTVNE
jgi:hypothetical protein